MAELKFIDLCDTYKYTPLTKFINLYNYFEIDINFDDNKAFCNALKNVNKDLVLWLYKTSLQEIITDTNTNTDTQIKILKHKPININNIEYFKIIILSATNYKSSTHDCLELLNCLISIIKSNNETPEFIPLLFTHIYNYAISIDILLLDWICSICNEFNLPFKNYINNDCLTMAIKNKNIYLINWIIKQVENNIIDSNSIEFTNEMFNLSLSINDKEISKKLYYVLNSSKIDIFINNNCAFKLVCIYGDVNNAKWLYTLSLEHGKPFNIHIDNDAIFRLSCLEGHFDICVWLYSFGNIDIRMNNDELFNYYSKTQKNPLMINWIGSLSKYYLVYDDYENYKYINYLLLPKTIDEIVNAPIFNHLELIKTLQMQEHEYYTKKNKLDENINCIVCKNINIQKYSSQYLIILDCEHFVCFNCLFIKGLDDYKQIKSPCCNIDFNYSINELTNYITNNTLITH